MDLKNLTTFIQVAELGNVANAAVTICKQPYFILVCLAQSLNICLSAVIARRKGQGDIKGANKAVHFGVMASFILAIVLSVTFVFSSTSLYISCISGLHPFISKSK